MTTHRLINRRMAIAEMGKAGLAVVVFGTAACSDGGADATTTTPGTTPTTSAGPGTTTTAPGSTTTPASTTTSGPASTGAAPTSYQRVNLQFVSAYILYRGGEAALVDTGVGGSAAAIQVALGETGLDWDDRTRDPHLQAPRSCRERRRSHDTSEWCHAVCRGG